MKNYSDYIVLIMELIGTVAFAASGAMTAIQKKMDIFGVIVLGITTAVGGGMIRDLILGVNPPHMFRNPVYAMTAIGTSLLVFLMVAAAKKRGVSRFSTFFNILLLLGDTIGLGIFTVVGTRTAILTGYHSNKFLLLFVGVLTGVGGGVLRDVMAQDTPYIFVKHVYAVASLAGAFVYIWLRPILPGFGGMLTGACTVMAIRLLAAKNHWNLPRI